MPPSPVQKTLLAAQQIARYFPASGDRGSHSHPGRCYSCLTSPSAVLAPLMVAARHEHVSASRNDCLVQGDWTSAIGHLEGPARRYPPQVVARCRSPGSRSHPWCHMQHVRAQEQPRSRTWHCSFHLGCHRRRFPSRTDRRKKPPPPRSPRVRDGSSRGGALRPAWRTFTAGSQRQGMGRGVGAAAARPVPGDGNHDIAAEAQPSDTTGETD